ncbi:MAG: alanine--tRNA ligase-related protein [Opitutaceae bacterium]|nr:alanine--tRNA ligase-related protein [Opitutaceae bacterium]
MTSAEIRQSFLDFFAQQGHTITPSSSLLPDSPGLLFTNAGMNQFVPIFLGDRAPDVSKWAGVRPSKDTRAADTQKCIRAGGKHNDLEDVGFDTYHHTLFEMLGNWSFGDYFKKESINWGWELITKVWGIPPKRLFATVYSPDKSKNDPSEFDQEAYDIWAKIFTAAGLDPAVHIVNGNKKDNFWMMGDTGPCGPCSEIHFNLLPSDEESAGRKLVNASSPRCIEIWNHVFIQFNANADGTFAPLAAKHVDTGMGFERVAGIHATTGGFKNFDKDPSNYAADVFAPLFAKITALSGKAYAATVPTKREGLTDQENIDIAFRVLADHARCVSCAIADGILPSNEGRNYVIRRILRRGILYGKKLGLPTGFFEQLVGPVVESLGGVFPELKQREDIVRRAIRSEEESFGRTLDRGLAVFQAEVAKFPGSARVPRAASGVSPDAPQDVRYAKRRLPHFERPWGKYHLTFTTHERRALSPAARQIVLDSLVHGHTQGRYHLFAACVMPDHVHALIEPQPKGKTDDGTSLFPTLTELLHSIKSFTAHEINKAGGATGPVWEKESFDRLIRGENDLVEKFRYIVDNPRADKLVGPDEDYPFLWTPPEGLRRDAEASPRDAGAPREISGAVAFQLYDTYGFPLDMTQLLATERGLTVDAAGFEAEMEKQRERGRASQKKTVLVAATEGDDTAPVVATTFTGYTLPTEPVTATVIDVISNYDASFVVFDTTPFYAEMGGQAGDTGTAVIAGIPYAIVDTIKDKAGRTLHKLGVPAGEMPSAPPFSRGAPAVLALDLARRRAISRHHSAAHLIHWALRKVLGTHVRQAGTSKTADRMRFDFSHFEAATPAQLLEVERLVNEKVIDNARVESYETEFDQKPEGTLAFFGDKYGKIVRVVDIGGYSRELCGGTHVTTTGEIGLIKVVAEMAIAAGTRRIEAVAGQPAFDFVATKEAALAALSAHLGGGVSDVVKKLETLLAQQKETEKQLKAFQQKALAGLAEELAAKATERDGLKFVSGVVSVSDQEALRSLGSQVAAKLGEGVVQLGAALGDKASLVAFCTPAAVKAGHQAGKIIQTLSAAIGGKGGGKPDFAMGGGKDIARLAEVLR